MSAITKIWIGLMLLGGVMIFFQSKNFSSEENSYELKTQKAEIILPFDFQTNVEPKCELETTNNKVVKNCKHFYCHTIHEIRMDKKDKRNKYLRNP